MRTNRFCPWVGIQLKKNWQMFSFLHCEVWWSTCYFFLCSHCANPFGAIRERGDVRPNFFQQQMEPHVVWGCGVYRGSAYPGEKRGLPQWMEAGLVMELFRTAQRHVVGECSSRLGNATTPDHRMEGSTAKEPAKFIKCAIHRWDRL